MNQDSLVNTGTSRGGNRHAVDDLAPRWRVYLAVTAARLAGVAGFGVSAPSTTPTGVPAPYLSEYEHGITIDHPISRKNRYAAGWLDFGNVRWEFCFDQDGDGWVCLPANSTGCERFHIGDRVYLRQEAGQFAVIVAN